MRPVAGLALAGLALAGGAVVLPATALAQNFQSVPLGGRSGAMGGAGAAFGRDAATPMMNPGNLVLLDKSTLSLSANVYGRSIATADRYFRLEPDIDARYGHPEKARLSLSSDVFDIFPSSLGYYKFFPDDDYPMVVSLSFFDAEHTHYSFSGAPQILFPDGAFRATGRALYQRDAYYFGPTYSVGLGPAFRIGISLFTIYQPLSSVRQAKSLRTAANNTVFSADEFEEFLNGSSTDFQGVLGGAFTASDFSLGLSLATPAFHITGSFDDELRESTTEPGGVETQPSLILIETFTGDLSLSRPVRFTLGAGYERKGSFAVAVDANVYLATADALSLSGDRRVDEIKQFGVSSSITKGSRESSDYAMVLDLSAGGEVSINDTSAVRFGVFFDRSAVDFPNPLETFNEFEVREDRIGGTLGYGISVGAFQSDFGVLGYLGSGEIISKELFGDAYFKAPLDTYGLLFFIAGSMDAESTRKKFADKLAPGAGAAAEAAVDPGALTDFGTVRPLSLGDLDPRLAKYAGRADLDALAVAPINLRQIDHPKYDRFFESGARFRGSVASTRLILDKARRDLEGEPAPETDTQTGVDGSVAAADELAAHPESITAERRHTLGETREALSLATNALKGLASQAKAIVKDGQALLGSASKDFKGPLAAKVPAIVAELTSLGAALAGAVAEAPGLVNDAAALVGAMARIPNLDLEMPALPNLPNLPKLPKLPQRPPLPAASGVEASPGVASLPAMPEAPPVPVPAQGKAPAGVVDAPTGVVDAPVAAVVVPVGVVEAPAGVVDAPAIVPAPAGGGDSGKPCFVAGRASVKFRVDASHKAKPSGLAAGGAELVCFDAKAGWRRVSLADGSASGYLPENLIRWRAE